MSQSADTGSSSGEECGLNTGGMTAEEAYAEHGEGIDEFCERDDALGAAARAIRDIALETNRGQG